ncbi:MAG TPA: trypsin-like peptidase domain-containing protein [Steroidobacteraceae bacterium]|nr:trypsin-like peptidase domain-containing protein [Steroidobacteraceae bacterium]
MSKLTHALRFIGTWALVGLLAAGSVLLARNGSAWWARLRGHAATEQNARSGTLPRSFADAVAAAAPAVVNIYTARLVSADPHPLDSPLLDQSAPQVRQRVEGSLGSGVIVDGQGHIVTNHHVIQGAAEIRVQLADGRTATPVIVGTDPDSDLAVLRIDISNPPAMPMGRSDELRAGDVVLAIGNPFGLSQTVTQGIVSATGRGRLGVTDFEDFIQTDAAINFGNSGGALINLDGELIGINTAVLSQTLGTDGISFAIPVNMVRGVMDEIIKHGHVLRGWLGVSTEELSRSDARALGISPPVALRITAIDPRGPAAASGLRVNDVLIKLNGQQLNTAQEALNRVAAMRPGTTITITVLRGKDRLNLSAVLKERPSRSERHP